MTVSYAGEVPNGSSFGIFFKILGKWRGSVYKLVWRELLAYLIIYGIINLVYRFALTEPQKRSFDTLQTYFLTNLRLFEDVRAYCGQQSGNIPMSFVLGFYVTLVVTRWWNQYKLLPWPDTLALFISAAIPGNNETGRLMRRNIMRYAVLAYVITLMRISLRVKRRFPTWQHLVDAGLMLESEKKIFEIMDSKSPMSKYWMPLVWATNIINRARKQEIIASDHIVQTLLVELSDIRRRLGALIGYDTVCVPLVYTQVVTLVLYTYFIATLIGEQMLPRDPSLPHSDKFGPDLYFPLFTALKFSFFVGWLKVAEVLINPFGEDDDDIELNWLIDRHIKASYMIVDEMHEEHPELLKDQYWEEVVPAELPYTVASEHYRRTEPKGSAENYKVKQADAMYANIIPSRRQNFDDVYADYESVDTPVVERRKNSGWLRQLTRMGSGRSSSTAYSSNGLFRRNRHNSVFSTAETGVLPGQQLNPSSSNRMNKMYDKLVGRKSIRNQRNMMKRDSKASLNGSIVTSAQLKNRPRIPTPDVSKDGMEKENRFIISEPISTARSVTAPSVGNSSIASGISLAPQQLQTSSKDEIMLGTMLLSPITENDAGSVHNSLTPGSPTTAALAKAVLPTQIQANSAEWRSLTNSPAHTRLMVFPGLINTMGQAQPQDILSVAVTSIAVTPCSYKLHPSTALMSDTHDTASIKSNMVITELGADHDSADDLDMKPLNRRNSMSMIGSKEVLSRQVSAASKSTESPSLPKRNQTITSSAPSTLTKAKPEQKTGEVYV